MVKFISALDLGSEEIKFAVCNFPRREKGPEILTLITENSFGLRKGVVIDPEKAAERIKRALKKATLSLNKKIREVVCNINGSHLFLASSRGVVAVSRADQMVSQEDIDRVIGAAQAFSLSPNKEILEIFPKEFFVDGEGGIKDPLNMKGIRLEAEILAVCCFSPYLKNLTQAISLADLDILDIIPSGLASSKSVLTLRQKELGVALLDIGAWTTNFTVFEEGDLVHFAVFPIGSGHITNDIAIGLQTDLNLAEKIKIEFGDCIYQKKRNQEKIELPLNISSKIENNEERKEKSIFSFDSKTKKLVSSQKRGKEGESFIFSRKLLIHIIAERVAEIFDQCQNELKKIGKQKSLPAGIIITGGGAKLPHIDEFAKKEFKLPSQIGYPKGIKGLEKNPSFSTIAGLLITASEIEKAQFFGRLGFISRLKRFFRIFLP